MIAHIGVGSSGWSMTLEPEKDEDRIVLAEIIKIHAQSLTITCEGAEYLDPQVTFSIQPRLAND